MMNMMNKECELKVRNTTSLLELQELLNEAKKERIAYLKIKEHALERAKKQYRNRLVGYVELNAGYKFYIKCADAYTVCYWVDYDDEFGITSRWYECARVLPENLIRV